MPANEEYSPARPVASSAISAFMPSNDGHHAPPRTTGTGVAASRRRGGKDQRGGKRPGQPPPVRDSVDLDAPAGMEMERLA